MPSHTNIPVPLIPPRGDAAGARMAAIRRSSWTGLDGRRTSLEDYRGYVVVLDFYATWCPPCRQQTPQLIALQRRYASQGLHVVGLNVGGASDRASVPGFVEEFGIQYRLGYPDEETADLFLSDNTAIPQTYVFDRNGQLLRRFIGYDPSSTEELDHIVQTALAAQ